MILFMENEKRLILLPLKSVFEAEALYNAIETQLEGMSVDSQERDYLLIIRHRLEQQIANKKRENEEKGSVY